MQGFKNAIVSPSFFVSLLWHFIWTDRVEEGKQHRNYANKSEDATVRFGGKIADIAKDLESCYSIISDTILMMISPECGSGTGSIDLGCWSSWESHKVLSYERRNGASQGVHCYNVALVPWWSHVLKAVLYSSFSFCQNYTGDKDNLGKCEQVKIIHLRFPWSWLAGGISLYYGALDLPWAIQNITTIRYGYVHGYICLQGNVLLVQFFLELMKVPRMESKLRVFSFKIQFGSQVADLRKSLNIIDSSCNEVCWESIVLSSIFFFF